MKEQSIFQSNEKKSNYDWLQYPENSLSSLFYIKVGYELLNSVDKKIEPDNIPPNIIILLGISSTIWWATKNKYAQIIDISCYSYIIEYVRVSVKGDEKSIVPIIYLITTPFISKKIIKKNNIISGINAIYTYIKYRGIDTTFSMFLSSFIFKYLDTQNINPIGSGTAWLHIISAKALKNLLKNNNKSCIRISI